MRISFPSGPKIFRPYAPTESANSAHTPIGENSITMAVILYIALAQLCTPAKRRSPSFPIMISATPKNTENTIICSIFVLVKEVKMLDGNISINVSMILGIACAS